MGKSESKKGRVTRDGIYERPLKELNLVDFGSREPLLRRCYNLIPRLIIKLS